MKWRPISTMQKLTHEQVLLTDGDVVDIGYWDKGWDGWSTNRDPDSRMGHVTHWMPLPNPVTGY